MCFGEGPLRADDALGDARDGDDEPARDLLGRETTEHPKGERDACVRRQDRMARHEDEAEEIVADVFVDRGVQVVRIPIPPEVASQLAVLAFERLAAADEIDRAMLRGRHQPRSRLLRHAGDGPLLQGGDQGVLRQLFGCPDIPDETGQPGDQPG